jgi:hypothetical protein
MVVDQLPLRLSEGAVKNTGTKIIHRLSALEDAREMGGSMGLGPEDAAYITRLRRGEALVYRSDMEVPAHVAVEADIARVQARISDEAVANSAATGGYSQRIKGPIETDRVVQCLYANLQDELINLGNSVLFSLLFGRLEVHSLNLLVGRAEDRLFELGREVHTTISEDSAGAVLVQIASDVLRANWHLKKNPVLHQKALECLSEVVNPTWTNCRLSFDSDAVLRLRGAFDEIAKSDPPEDNYGLDGKRYEGVARFLRYSRCAARSLANHLATQQVDCELTLDLVVEKTVANTRLLLLSEGGDRVCEYGLAMAVQAYCMLGNNPVGDDLISKVFNRIRRGLDSRQRETGK